MSRNAQALWDQLHEAGVVSGEMPATSDIESPWFVRVLIGFSGWIAALFLFGFVAVGLEFIIDSETASITVGLIALAGAFAILLADRNDFYQQFGLAVSFAGQVLIIYGLGRLLDWDGAAIWWMVALLQVVVALVMPNFAQRVVAAWVAVYTLSVALAYHQAPSLGSVLATLVIAIIWLNEFSWRRWGMVLRPVGYGMTLALIQLKGELLFGSPRLFYVRSDEALQLSIPAWLGELAVGLLLVAVVARLLNRSGELWGSQRMLVALLVAAAVAAVSLEAPGIATGLTVMLLGFSNGNRILVGLGIAALLFYLSAYYYTLETTLLVKSEILAATGVVLLLVRWVVLKWVLPPREDSDA
jgi:uncharacterized membrane protein